MKFLTYMALTFCLPQLYSCNEPVTENVAKYDVTDAPNIDTTDKVRADITHQQLINYLPALNDFDTLQPPTGETRSNRTSGGKLSFAKQSYFKPTDTIYIEILDYKWIPEQLAGIAKAYGINNPWETSIQKTVEVILPFRNVSAAATINKEDPNIRLSMVVSDRFMINILANGSHINLEYVKAIAEKIKIKELQQLMLSKA